MQPDIISFGEPLLEFAQTEDADGEAVYRRGFGGDTSNTAIAAARQGAKVGYLTALSADPFGDTFLRLWQDEGVDASRVLRDPEANIGVYFITPSPEGRDFAYFRAGSAASRIRPEQLPRDYITGAKVLHASGISQAISASACDSVFEAFKIARAQGVLVSYDTNLRLQLWPLERARAVIHETLRLCDLALPSLDDSQQLTGLADPEAILAFYAGLGPRVVALKMGRAGALVSAEGRTHRVPGRVVEAVDATGAGDTFDGAFLAKYLESGDAFAAADYANAAAALTTTGLGAVAPIPRAAQVEAFLRQDAA
ncbi:MAG: sugar kinase [Kiloniellales bacterium]|nr:sugar kinase [Kiloniellales bacterium]